MFYTACSGSASDAELAEILQCLARGLPAFLDTPSVPVEAQDRASTFFSILATSGVFAVDDSAASGPLSLSGDAVQRARSSASRLAPLFVPTLGVPPPPAPQVPDLSEPIDPKAWSNLLALGAAESEEKPSMTDDTLAAADTIAAALEDQEREISRLAVTTAEEAQQQHAPLIALPTEREASGLPDASYWLAVAANKNEADDGVRIFVRHTPTVDDGRPVPAGAVALAFCVKNVSAGGPLGDVQLRLQAPGSGMVSRNFGAVPAGAYALATAEFAGVDLHTVVRGSLSFTAQSALPSARDFAVAIPSGAVLAPVAVERAHYASRLNERMWHSRQLRLRGGGHRAFEALRELMGAHVVDRPDADTAILYSETAPAAAGGARRGGVVCLTSLVHSDGAERGGSLQVDLKSTCAATLELVAGQLEVGLL